MATNNCDTGPREFLPNEPCEIAVGLINALLSTTSANAVLRVRIGDRETAYQRVDAANIRQLRMDTLTWCQSCMRQNPTKAAQLGIDQYLKDHAQFAVHHNRPNLRPYR